MMEKKTEEILEKTFKELDRIVKEKQEQDHGEEQKKERKEIACNSVKKLKARVGISGQSQRAITSKPPSL